VSRLTIPLSVEGAVLRPLLPLDACAYRALLQRNTHHLGPDYADDICATEAQQAAAFAGNPDPPVMFGIFATDELIGRIDLVPVHPPRYGLGYWVSEDHTGLGIATAAVAAVVDYAQQSLAATDIFAGVAHGNTASERVLERNCFARVAEFDTYCRFHRALIG